MSIARRLRLPQTVTIANGTALSPAIDLGEMNLAAIVLPATWTTANLTFQGGVKDPTTGTITYADITDKSGAEYTVTAAQGKANLIPVSDLAGFRYLKVRSGTSSIPVNQGADRVLTFVGVTAL